MQVFQDKKRGKESKRVKRVKVDAFVATYQMSRKKEEEEEARGVRHKAKGEGKSI